MKKISILNCLLVSTSLPISLCACGTKGTIELYDVDIIGSPYLKITILRNIKGQNFEASITVNDGAEIDYLILKNDNDIIDAINYSFKDGLLIINSSAITGKLLIQPIMKESVESELEKKYNDYAEKYQKNFIDNITEQYHDFYRSDNLYCSSDAEGVIMWTYGPGFDEWGTEFHKGHTEEEIEVMPNRKTHLGIPNCLAPKDLSKAIERLGLDIRMRDFHWLDNALSQSTAGTNITVYHGYEYNEYEMMETINSNLGTTDVLTVPAEEARMIDLTPLKNKTITDLCWCATTFEETFAKEWAHGSDKINIPVYEMHLSPDVNCAYVSYSRKKHFDGIYLAWPHEYQVLTQRKLKFKIIDAKWEPRPDNKGNFLLIECNVTK